ncbi:MAG: hypothetical protein KatS3mg101_0706 [Patescibacteria group bacterium]|nr:MAG: hypothetical protein KatS3mg101_0706 [Patescibacteria group bacterium]
MQFLVSEIPHQITKDFRNEYAQRLPFAIISVAAVGAFYLMVRKLTQSDKAAIISSALYLVNGFIVGFGRIAQYQNLNLLFNFLALYFYADLIRGQRNLIRSSLLGTLFFSLSILSHWDAIFILPVMVYIFVVFLTRKQFSRSYKIRVLLYNFGLGCLLLLPFLIPYISASSGASDNKEYFLRRVRTGYSNKQLYLELIRLYNPFLFLEFVAVPALVGLVRIKKALPFLLWFVFGFAVFELVVRKPGTHIYNFVLPCIVLAGMGIHNLISIVPRWVKWLPTTVFVLSFIFLYYQSYYLFVDHSREYPWERKELFEPLRNKYKHDLIIGGLVKNIPQLTTASYSIEQKLPLFGFPHFRHWNEINDYINEQNSLFGENYGYITNEDKTISEWYIDAKYRANNGFYIIVVRNPVNFVVESTYPQYPNKDEVKRFYNDGRWVVKIYKVYKEDGGK